MRQTNELIAAANQEPNISAASCCFFNQEPTLAHLLAIPLCHSMPGR